MTGIRFLLRTRKLHKDRADPPTLQYEGINIMPMFAQSATSHSRINTRSSFTFRLPFVYLSFTFRSFIDREVNLAL
jgi:hypothetical protein